jgi:large subunit ribosomal protein L4
MSTAPVVDLTGETQGELELPETVFSVIPHATVMHQALLRQLANARQGTHDSKTRTEVSGGGRKPYRQKGTGRARQGSIRAPHYAGGGVVFGPTPRDHSLQMPRKQRRLALRSALSVKAAESQITVLDRIELEEPKTKVVTGFLQALEAGRRVLVVLGSHHDALEMSARNLPEVRVILAGNISVRDLLTADTVVMTRDAVEHIAEAWG